MDMLGRRDHGHAGEEGWSIRYVIKGILARSELHGREGVGGGEGGRGRGVGEGERGLGGGDLNSNRSL